MQIQKKKNIILGAGGTGGHLFPAQSVAHAAQEKGYEVILITDSRGMRFANGFEGCQIITLPTVNIFKGKWTHRLKGFGLLIWSMMISFYYMLVYRPKAVIGFGGYPAFPSGVAAFLTCRPLYLHEQNAIIGRVNKVLLKGAKKIFCSFQNTKGVRLTSKKFLWTGNPVRMQILNHKHLEHNEQQTEHFHILVTGGSQGSQIFSEEIPLIFDILPPHIKNKISIHQQVRKEDIEQVTHLYERLNVQANIVAFIQDMGEALSKANLVICRSGASTLSEIATLGKAAIFIPLPTAKDNQQQINAEYFENNKAGKMLLQKHLTPPLLASMILDFYQKPEKIKEIEKNVIALAKENAAQIIINEIK